MDIVLMTSLILIGLVVLGLAWMGIEQRSQRKHREKHAH